jgi:hypothetical protein
MIHHYSHIPQHQHHSTIFPNKTLIVNHKDFQVYNTWYNKHQYIND